MSMTPIIEKRNTVLREAIPPSSRLLLTLRFLAAGARFPELGYSFRVSITAISRIIPETLTAIYSVLKDEYLRVPATANEWKEVVNQFEKKWNFPKCLGAIDGKHIAIRARKEDGSYFFNYKQFHSVILLAVVDANYKFLYVDVGTNGRANDAAVFNQSALGSAIKNDELNFPDDENLPFSNTKVPFVFVADDAFRLSSKVLKPHSQRNNMENRIFNYRLSRARRVVENAFGILANKLKIFEKDINLSVEKVELITMAACALHNFIREEEGFQGLIDVENTVAVEIYPGSWRERVVLTSLERSRGNRSGEEGVNVRAQFTNYFNTAGAVPWQWEAVNKFNF